MASRPETESYTTRLAELLVTHLRSSQGHSGKESSPPPLKILDLCSGTGCIPLLLYSRLHPVANHFEIVGVDISPKATSLARKNLQWNLQNHNLGQASTSKQIQFLRADLFAKDFLATLARQAQYPSQSPWSSRVDTGVNKADSPHQNDAGKLGEHQTGNNHEANARISVTSSGREEQGHDSHDDVNIENGNGIAQEKWDILISNPPYISPRGFAKQTSRSVRNWEPKLALVPWRSTSPTSACSIPSGEEVSSACSSSIRRDVPCPCSIPAKAVLGRHLKRKDDEAGDGDEFYPRLLLLAKDLDVKIALFEVGSLNQAIRVTRMAKRMGVWDGIEIWRDWVDQTTAAVTTVRIGVRPSETSFAGETMMMRSSEGRIEEQGKEEENQERKAKAAEPYRDERVVVRGLGNGRCVVCWKGEGGRWLGL